MQYWLMKTEPDTFSWSDQVKRGAKGEPWTGVRNHQAKANMLAMKKGDRAFFYHSNEGKEIVGIVEVIREAYADPTDASARFVCVDVKAMMPLKMPVTLLTAKGEKRLKEMVLVNNSRLSVQPVTAAEWRIVCTMGGVENA